MKTVTIKIPSMQATKNHARIKALEKKGLVITYGVSLLVARSEFANLGSIAFSGTTVSHCLDQVERWHSYVTTGKSNLRGGKKK